MVSCCTLNIEKHPTWEITFVFLCLLICFHSDCVIGHSDGVLSFLDVESGAIFVRIELDLAKYEESALTSIKFSRPHVQHNENDALNNEEFYQTLPSPSSLVPNFASNTLTEDQLIVYKALQRHLLEGSEKQLLNNILACFGKKLNIYLLAGGSVLIAVIQLGAEISPLPLLHCLTFDCHYPSGQLMAVCEYKMRNIKSYCVYKITSTSLRYVFIFIIVFFILCQKNC